MRLIDGDALIAKFDECADWGVCQVINKEPTVDVLEQIRAEIEAIDTTMGIKDYPFIPKAKVLDIIDKYKGDKE